MKEFTIPIFSYFWERVRKEEERPRSSEQMFLCSWESLGKVYDKWDDEEMKIVSVSL